MANFTKFDQVFKLASTAPVNIYSFTASSLEWVLEGFGWWKPSVPHRLASLPPLRTFQQPSLNC